MTFEERLKKGFGKRMRSGQWPTFFPFDAEGVVFIGQISGEHQSDYWDKDNPLRVMHAIEVKTGEEFSMPTVRGVQAAWNSLKVEVGDYVYLEYLGETKLKRGAGKVKSYNVSKLTEEEFAAIKDGKTPDIPAIVHSKEEKEAPAAPPVTENEDEIVQDFITAMKKGDKEPIDIARELATKHKVSIKVMRGIAEKALLEMGSEEAEEPEEETPETTGDDTEQKVAVRTLVSDILDFYDEIDKDRLEKSLKTSGIKVTVKEALEICKDIIVVKGKTIKRKE